MKELEVHVVGGVGTGKSLVASLITRILESHGIKCEFIEYDDEPILTDEYILNHLPRYVEGLSDDIKVKTVPARRKHGGDA